MKCDNNQPKRTVARQNVAVPGFDGMRGQAVHNGQTQSAGKAKNGELGLKGAWQTREKRFDGIAEPPQGEASLPSRSGRGVRAKEANRARRGSRHGAADDRVCGV